MGGTNEINQIFKRDWIIRKLRIGNSDLNIHKTPHGRNRLCKNCDDGLPEKIDHFLLRCNKYTNERKNLEKNIRKNLDHMKIKFTILNLLGMNERIMIPRKLTKRYDNRLKDILWNTIKYIKRTKRFKLQNY